MNFLRYLVEKRGKVVVLYRLYLPRIGGESQFAVDGHLCNGGNTVFERDSVGDALSEYVYLSAAVGAGDVAHIFDYAQDGHVHHLSHVYRLGNYHADQILRRGHNDYTVEREYAALQGKYPQELLKEATSEDFGTEFLDYKMSVKTVSSIEEALKHIQHYSSKHSECIVTENPTNAALFCRKVDAACVYVNAPTSFTDGAQFGLGAEIGISTQKLHARGPMALEEITTYKWIIEGDGQIRKP